MTDWLLPLVLIATMLGALLGLSVGLANWLIEVDLQRVTPRQALLEFLRTLVLCVLWWISVPVLLVRLVLRNEWRKEGSP